MQTNEENTRLERVLVVFYLIFTGLGLICERFYYYHLCMLSGTITINGFHTNMLVSIFSIFLPVVMYISRDILKRSFVWMIWCYFLISGCFGIASNVVWMNEHRRWCAEVGTTVDETIWFRWILSLVISVFVLLAKLLTVTKYRSRIVLILQLIIFGVLLIYYSLSVYGSDMRMMLYREPTGYYARWQGYCGFFSAFFYIFWMYVKKDPKPKKAEALVFVDGQWRCGACGEAVKDKDMFCAMCGKKVR